MSPTPGERKALIFLASVLLVGGVVKATGAARRGEAADAASREGLRRQIVAAESAAAVERRERRGRGSRGKRQTDVVARGNIPREPPAPPDRVDVDRASAAELERLPRIGPTLAARIVAERERNGPYGSLEGLQRVSGIGPAMARQLAATVTFSGTPRPSNAGEAGGSPSTVGGAKRRRSKAARVSPPP